MSEVHLNDKLGAPIQSDNPLPVTQSLVTASNPLPVEQTLNSSSTPLYFLLANNPLTTDLKLRTSANPYGYDISEGNIPGHTSYGKMGYNPDIANVEEDIWAVGGTYVFPTGAMGMEVISSSADDAGAGTGVQTVKIWYLTTAFVEKTEVVTLNGTTAVPTVATDIYRINNFRAATAGTGGKAAGNIDIRHLTDTPIYSRIPTGLTRARNSVFTVPAGKTYYITRLSYSAGAASAGHYTRFTLRANYDDITQAPSALFFPYSEIGVQDGSFTIDYEIPMRFTAGVDIKVSAVSDIASAAVACNVQYRGWLE